MYRKTNLIGLLLLGALSSLAQTKQWTLKDCLDYALEHNIQLQQNKLSKQSSTEDVKQSKAQLLPSLSFSTSQNVSFRPFPEDAAISVQSGYVETSTKKTTYNGTYGVSANWTVWNGNKNVNTVRKNKITEQQADLTTRQTANSIQEQITLLYVEILYSIEGVKVCEKVAEIGHKNYERGQAMFKVGQISKAQLAQLESQAATDDYNLVNTKGQVAKYKLQLKQLLEIVGTEEFDIATPASSDDEALAVIPSAADTYSNALVTRPEIIYAQLGIKSSDLQLKIARAGYMPTVGITGSIGTTTMSSSGVGYGKQMKGNLNGGLGFTLSIPIADQRQTKTSIRKAKIQQETSKLQLQDAQKKLWSSVEGFWLDANTNQARFKSAQISVNSAQESYSLVTEQFKEGLKNIQELSTGETTLLNAEQSRLESKYTTIYNIQMLKFYNGQEITL